MTGEAPISDRREQEGSAEATYKLAVLVIPGLYILELIVVASLGVVVRV